MIAMIHNSGKSLVKVIDMAKNEHEVSVDTSETLATTLCQLAERFPDRIIGWFDEALYDHVDVEEIDRLFLHDCMLFSYSAQSSYFSDDIGYVEDSPFIQVNKEVRYPTWLMSADIGVVKANILRKFNTIEKQRGLGYFLCSMAKVGMPSGLCCYSAPTLLKSNAPATNTERASNSKLFRFVRNHYKANWATLLFLNKMVHEKRIVLWSFLKSLFYAKRIVRPELSLVSKHPEKVSGQTIDVVIPTLGRKKYLYDVLRDLSIQTVLPNSVIIVEQNPEPESTSELDYLESESWPFRVKHLFTHTTGACNARNMAIEEITSNWAFLADDDIRFKEDLLERSLATLHQYGERALTISCLREHDEQTSFEVIQWPTFGSGCSVVHSDMLKQLRFDLAYEHGFGEDIDFGMQLRNTGADVLYFPKETITHLKAPVGGFRTSHQFPWESEQVLPKPSPTLMLYRHRHTTKKQLLGYKTILLIKFYRQQEFKNPIRYYRRFMKRWKVSEYWARKLATTV